MKACRELLKKHQSQCDGDGGNDVQGTGLRFPWPSSMEPHISHLDALVHPDILAKYDPDDLEVYRRLFVPEAMNFESYENEIYRLEHFPEKRLNEWTKFRGECKRRPQGALKPSDIEPRTQFIRELDEHVPVPLITPMNSPNVFALLLRETRPEWFEHEPKVSDEEVVASLLEGYDETCDTDPYPDACGGGDLETGDCAGGEMFNADHVAMSDPLVPRGFKEYIGQENAKEILDLMRRSAEYRSNGIINHVLFTGTGGMGKTGITKALAQELDCYFRFTTATNMNAFKPDRDIDPLLDAICEVNDTEWHGKRFGILFIDEIHRLSPEQWERLYSVMEGGQFDSHLGLMDVKETVIIGATTDPHRLPLSARTRFRVIELEPYTEKEMGEIVAQGARKLDCEIKPDAVGLIAKNSRGNPRLALNTFVRTSIDVAAGDGMGVVALEHAKKALSLCGIINQDDGLSNKELRYLAFLFRQKREGNNVVGLKSLVCGLGEIQENIETIIEPFLVQNEYILRTHRGRQITQKGLEAVTRLTGCGQ